MTGSRHLVQKSTILSLGQCITTKSSASSLIYSPNTQQNGRYSQLGIWASQDSRFSTRQRDAPRRQKEKTEIKLRCPSPQEMIPLAMSDFLRVEPSPHHLWRATLTLISFPSHKNPCPRRSSQADCSPPHPELKQAGAKYPSVLKEGTAGLSIWEYEIILHLRYINDISLRCEINVPYVNMGPFFSSEEKRKKWESQPWESFLKTWKRLVHKSQKHH